MRASAAVSPLRSVRAPPTSDQPPPCARLGVHGDAGHGQGLEVAPGGAHRRPRARRPPRRRSPARGPGGTRRVATRRSARMWPVIAPKLARRWPLSGRMMARMTTDDHRHRGQGLTKRFGPSQVAALDGLDLVAPAGQVTAVLGPNGAGKTTFVRAVATLLRPDAGRARGGRHRRRRHPERVRRVDRPGRPARRRRAGDDRPREPRDGGPPVRSRPPGGACAPPTPCSTSSASTTPPTGWCAATRAACAAGSTSAPAWSARPACCCSTSRPPGLDPRSRIELWDAIRALVRAGTDVLLTTQYLEEADQLADHIMIVDHGRADRRRHARRAEGRGRARRRRDPGRAGPPTSTRSQARARAARHARRPAVDEPARRVAVAGRPTAPSASPTAVRALADRRHRRSTTSACAGRPSTRCSSPSPAGRRRPADDRRFRPATIAAIADLDRPAA